MSDFQVLVFSLSCYKLTTLIIGTVFGILGYRLFKAGVYEKAGELKTTWGDKNLVVKQAAPGTFFALFGVILISTTLMKGLNLENMKSATPSRTADADYRPFVVRGLEGEEKAVVERLVNGGTLNEKDKQILKAYLEREQRLEETMKGNAKMVLRDPFVIPKE